MSSVCHRVRWYWTSSHPHVSQWGDICVRQQDVGDDAHDFGGDWRLHQADVDHLAELLHHRLQLRVVQFLADVQLTVHQLLDQVHDIGCVVLWNRTGRVSGGLKLWHLTGQTKHKLCLISPVVTVILSMSGMFKMSQFVMLGGAQLVLSFSMFSLLQGDKSQGQQQYLQSSMKNHKKLSVLVAVLKHLVVGEVINEPNHGSIVIFIRRILYKVFGQIHRQRMCVCRTRFRWEIFLNCLLSPW